MSFENLNSFSDQIGSLQSRFGFGFKEEVCKPFDIVECPA